MDEGRFENLLARNMIDEEREDSHDSDVYFGGHHNYKDGKEEDYEKRRINKNKQKKNESDRQRERSK